MTDITQHTDYRQTIAAIKQRIQASQTRAVLAVNTELLNLYWDIGRQRLPVIGVVGDFAHTIRLPVAAKSRDCSSSDQATV